MLSVSGGVGQEALPRQKNGPKEILTPFKVMTSLEAYVEKLCCEKTSQAAQESLH